MLMGATGSGKSTLVDSIVNYIAGVSFDDSFRFTVVALENEEKRTENQVHLTTLKSKLIKVLIVDCLCSTMLTNI